MKDMFIICILYLILGILLGISITTHFLEPRSIRNAMAQEIVDAFNKVTKNRQSFTCGYVKLSDTNNNTVFLSAKEYEELIDRINKILDTK